MSLAVLAQDMASKGRNGDSMLVHMTPGEVAGLHALALKHGGTLTINPETGLPEANFLKNLLPAIAGFALNYFVPGLGNAVGLGLSNAATAGVLVGGATGLATGSLSKGLMAGLGAYGGFGLGESLMGAGASAMGDAAASSAYGASAGMTDAAAQELGFASAEEAAQNAAARSLSNFDPTSLTSADKFSAGFNAVKADPLAFAKDNFKYLAAGATPIMADMMVPTTTKTASPTDTGNIRKFSYDPYAQRYTPQGVFPAAGYKGGMAEGGIVALADGGAPANPAPGSEQYVTNVKNWFEKNPNATAADVQGAMQQYGLNQQDVQNAMKQAGLSGAAQFAAFNTDIGNAANTAETYGGIKGLSNNINYWLNTNPGASAQDIRNEMKKWDLSDQDFIRATGTDINNYAMGPITKVQNLAGGVGGNTSAVVNENGTVTQVALPTNVTGGQPTGTVQNIKDIYTQGGGSLGYVNNAPKTMQEFNQRFNTLTPGGDSEAAYNYLMGKGAYPTRSNVGEIMKPYSEAVLGVPQDLSTKKYIYNPTTRKMVLNPDYVPMTFDTKGVQSYGLSQSDISKYLNANNTATDAQVYAWALANNVNPDQIAAALNADPAVIRAKYNAAKGTAGATADVSNKDKKPTSEPGSGNEWQWEESSKKWIAAPVYVGMADGGITGNGQLNLNIPLNLGGGSNGGYSAVGSGSGGGFGALNPEFTSRLGNALSNNVSQSGLPDVRSQMQGLDAKINQLPSVTAYNDYGKSITGRAPTADEMAQLDKLRSAIHGDQGFMDLQGQMQSLGNKYQQQAMGNQSAGLQQRYVQQAPNMGRGYADGGVMGYALGGLGSLGGYSDGGRLLKGPGDGVSDSIPATIGRKKQPARLADGEFVIPARIVSELGNGSTEAGARKLYAMMDRVQRARGKTTGKNKVAANSRADKHLPA